MLAKISRLSALPMALLLLNSACSTPDDGKPKSGAYVIIAPSSEFYKYGPAQSFGPDISLHRGDEVTLLKRSFGYSHIMLADGMSGYVATEDLAAAPPSMKPPLPRIASLRGGSTSHPKTSDVRPNKDPLFDVNDVPLPKPQDQPKFRY